MKIKSIYKITPNALTKLIASDFKEKKIDKPISYWQQMLKWSTSASARFVLPCITAFNTLKLSSYFFEEEMTEEEITKNVYFLLFQAAVSGFGMISYEYMRKLIKLSPTVSFRQRDYITNELIISALKEIKQERPEEVKDWLKFMSVQTFDETIPFFLKEINQGYCYGAVMFLMEQCTGNEIGNIQHYIETMKLKYIDAIKKQILYLMVRATELESIDAEDKPRVVFYSKDKKKMANKLMDSIYEQNQNVAAQFSAISLSQGSSVFLDQLLSCLIKSDYFSVKEAGYRFLQDTHELDDMFPLYKFYPSYSKKTQKIIPIKGRFLDVLQQQQYLRKREEEAKKAKEKRTNYITEHSSTCSEINFLFIKLTITNPRTKHATAIFINKENCFFFDPNIGLFECNSLQSLAEKIILIVNTLYSDFDLNQVKLLVHMPVVPLSGNEPILGNTNDMSAFKVT